jgi:serine/threonine-protein kinase
MAPERLDGLAGGPGVDVYALAAMAFEMLSGRKAVDGSTPLEIARRVATAPPADLLEAVPDAPPAAAEALKRGLAKDPRERPESAGELVRELTAAYAAKAEQDARERRAAAAPPPAPAPRAAAPAVVPVPPAAPEPARPARDPEPREPTTAPRRREPREPTTAPRIHRGTRRPRWVGPAALAALGVAALAALAIVLATSGGGDTPASDTSASSGQTQQQGSQNGTGSSSGGGSGQSQTGSGGSAPAPTQDAPSAPTASGPTSTSGATAPDPSTPTGAVAAFYIDSANGRYRQAWNLGTARLHGQLTSYQAHVAQERSLESISFPSLKVSDQHGHSAVVSFQSIARHTDRTDHCTGTIDVVKRGSGWMVDYLHITGCTPS